MQLNKYIEHTLLKQDATKEELIKLLDEAKQYDFLGVCVNPVNVKFTAEYLKDNGVKVVTVIGFPLGQSTTEAKVLETIDAVKNGADEIDMVLNTGKLKDGEFDYLVKDISAIKGACQGRDNSLSNIRSKVCPSRLCRGGRIFYVFSNPTLTSR